MIVFSGQLGNSALGSLELGRMPIYGVFVAHRGRPRSAVSALTAAASVTRPGVLSAVRSPIALSSVRRGFQARSAVRAAQARSEVGDG